MPRRPHLDPTIGERIQSRRLLRGWSVRYAASRSGISHATWSRIERGLQAADNRFVLAAIAAALECAPVDLTGTAMPAGDRAAIAAQASMASVRTALVDIDLAEPAAGTARPITELTRDHELLRDHWRRCDFAAAGRLLPRLLRDVHAATTGKDREPALRLLFDASWVASSTARSLGYPAEAWLGAERSRDVAEALGDEILVGYAAFGRAMAALSCGSFGRGLTLAKRAAHNLEPRAGQPRAQAVLGSLYVACAYASRALKQADGYQTWASAAHELALRTGDTTTHWLYFGPTNLNFWRIAADADGDDPERAVATAQSTDPTRIDAMIRRIYFYTDVARAYAQLAGMTDSAVRYLVVAERAAPQFVHSSPLIRETVHGLLRNSAPQRSGAPLRGLCERMGIAAERLPS